MELRWICVVMFCSVLVAIHAQRCTLRCGPGFTCATINKVGEPSQVQVCARFRVNRRRNNRRPNGQTDPGNNELVGGPTSFGNNQVVGGQTGMGNGMSSDFGRSPFGSFPDVLAGQGEEIGGFLDPINPNVFQGVGSDLGVVPLVGEGMNQNPNMGMANPGWTGRNLLDDMSRNLKVNLFVLNSNVNQHDQGAGGGLQSSAGTSG